MNDTRLELLALLGGKCVITDCNVIDVDMLHLDHIKDDGKEDRKRFGSNCSIDWRLEVY